MHRTIMLLGFFSIVTGAVAADLPLIEVDPDSITAFRERGTGRPFVAVGVNYYDPQTGWAPKVWQQFDEARISRHLDLLAEQGYNTIRVFITLVSFEPEPGKLGGDGPPKFRKLLEMCGQRGIYVIPTGPELWEGAPEWYKGRDRFADEQILTAEESWWREFAAAFGKHTNILAWDLANEPMVAWKTPAMLAKWNGWLADKYGNSQAMRAAWKLPAEGAEALGEVSIPPNEPDRGNLKLLDYQRFREHIGGEWVRRMTTAIRSADSEHMITVGHIQWASPVMLPSVWHYAGFNLRAETEYVDFTTIHFYPLEQPRPCDAPEGVDANAVYLQALLRDCSVGKPLMIGEFNWYGGGGIQGDHGWQLPEMPVEHQVEWCARLLQVSRGRVCGWLNWGFADTPSARDVSRWSGCWTTDLQLKPWGKVFGQFAREVTARPDQPREFDKWLSGARLDWSTAVTDPTTGHQYRQELRRAATQPN